MFNLLTSYKELKESNPLTTQYIHMIPYVGYNIDNEEIDTTCFYTLDIDRSVYRRTIESVNEIVNFIKDNNLTELEAYAYINYKLTEVEYVNKKVDGNLRNNIFGSLGNKLANCCGFANAQNFLLNAIGIESYMVYTKEKNSSGVHFFNITKLKDKGDMYVMSDSSLDRSISDDNISYKCFGSSWEELRTVQRQHSFDYNVERIYDIEGEDVDINLNLIYEGLSTEQKAYLFMNIQFIEGKNIDEISEYLNKVQFKEKELQINEKQEIEQ